MQLRFGDHVDTILTARRHGVDLFNRAPSVTTSAADEDPVPAGAAAAAATAGAAAAGSGIAFDDDDDDVFSVSQAPAGPSVVPVGRASGSWALAVPAAAREASGPDRRRSDGAALLTGATSVGQSAADGAAAALETPRGSRFAGSGIVYKPAATPTAAAAAAAAAASAATSAGGRMPSGSATVVSGAVPAPAVGPVPAVAATSASLVAALLADPLLQRHREAKRVQEAALRAAAGDTVSPLPRSPARNVSRRSTGAARRSGPRESGVFAFPASGAADAPGAGSGRRALVSAGLQAMSSGGGSLSSGTPLPTGTSASAATAALLAALTAAPAETSPRSRDASRRIKSRLQLYELEDVPQDTASASAINAFGLLGNDRNRRGAGPKPTGSFYFNGSSY
jgi:hypothetical protein